MTHRPLLHSLLFLIIFSLTQLFSVEAQALAERTSSSAVRSIKIMGTAAVIEDQKVVLQLQWDTATQRFIMVALANNSTGVYFAKRFSKKGIEAFGVTEAPIEHLRKEKKPIKFKGKVDLSEPYVIRWKKNKFIIRAYTETSELKKLFSILNELLLKRAIPKINKVEAEKLSYTELELGEGLMFKSRGKSFWK